MSNGSFTLLSATLFIMSIYTFKKTAPSKTNIGLFFCMAFCSFFLLMLYWVAYYFTGNGIDEATVYHLKYGLGDAGFLEYFGFIFASTSALMLGFIFLLWFLLKNRNYTNNYKKVNSLSSYSLLSAALLVNPGSIDIYNLQKHNIIFTQQPPPQLPTDFSNFYKKPTITPLNKDKKNIVFIYAESLERTYFDQNIFPGLIKGLRELETRSTFFTNIKQVAGTGWTIAGMTASQCGIPLFTPTHGESMANKDTFLSAAVCLGDLLNSAGYNLNYLGGASLDFTGKGKFYSSHGFSSVTGRDKLLTTLEDKTYKTGWGLYDDSILDLAFNKFLQLSSQQEKFGLFTLTLDTHSPNGHPSKSCEQIKYQDGSNSILNAVACSDYLISNYINKIIQSPYADKTIIALVSDHLAMRTTASELLESKDRRNLFMIIDPSINKSNEQQTLGSTLDIGTTILPLIGYSGDIGLGRDLLNATEPEEDRLFIKENLFRWKLQISKFWDNPQNTGRY